MTRNRLPYETTAGNIAPRETFLQLLEYLRLAQEDARNLAIARKLRSDHATAKGWASFAENFQKVHAIVTALATRRTASGVGYVA